jgi:hypothetical protein
MSNIQVQVKGSFREAKAIRGAKELAVSNSCGYSSFTVPSLTDYEVVELR